MCEVKTSTDLEAKSEKIKQRIEELRLHNPKLYSALNPVLDEMVLFLDSAAAHVLRQYNSILRLRIEYSEQKNATRNQNAYSPYIRQNGPVGGSDWNK